MNVMWNKTHTCKLIVISFIPPLSIFKNLSLFFHICHLHLCFILVYNCLKVLVHSGIFSLKQFLWELTCACAICLSFSPIFATQGTPTHTTVVRAVPLSRTTTYAIFVFSWNSTNLLTISLLTCISVHIFTEFFSP